VITLGQLTAIMAAMLGLVVLGVLWKAAPGAGAWLGRRMPRRREPRADPPAEGSRAALKAEPPLAPANGEAEPTFVRRRKIGVVGGREEEATPDNQPIPAEFERDLEQAFELFAGGRITLAAYRDFVTACKRDIELRLSEYDGDAKVQDDGDDTPDSQGASLKAALHAVDWCLAWADTLEQPPAS